MAQRVFASQTASLPKGLVGQDPRKKHFWTEKEMPPQVHALSSLTLLPSYSIPELKQNILRQFSGRTMAFTLLHCDN